MPTLEWIGKDKVVNHHLDVPFKVLEEAYTFGEEESGNKIIQGDNLEALKSLLPQYEGKIKCIYIDPPYNTGNEKWVYNDNVNDPRIKKWLGDVVGKEGEDLSRHDKWLCMMYPRLKLLHRLLAEDGAIFVSIDSNENSYLRLLMDEIFGRKNSIAEVACVNNPKGRSDEGYIATAHESILVYRKTDKSILYGFKPEEKVTKRYNKKDQNGQRYREIDLRKTGSNDTRIARPNLFYPFFYLEETNELMVGSDGDITPKGYIRIEPMKTSEIEGSWRWGRATAEENRSVLIAKFMPNKKQWTIFEKDYLTEDTRVKPTSVWDFKDVNSERGTELFIDSLGFLKDDFENPKPLGTIERILKIATSPDSIILDSFAGSGTTAHAVLKLNKQDGGNRKFILIEMMDYAENITAERVRRVINGYGEGEKAVEGTGGGFEFYHLGLPLLIDNKYLNEDVPEEKIREYIYFTETKEEYVACDVEPHLLGTHLQASYYFYYEKEQQTTLNREFLATIQTKSEEYIIYADVNQLSDEEMKAMHISFKKIPRDIKRL